MSKFREALDFVFMDAGYDQLKNYKAALKHGAQALISLNLRYEKELIVLLASALGVYSKEAYPISDKPPVMEQ